MPVIIMKAIAPLQPGNYETACMGRADMTTPETTITNATMPTALHLRARLNALIRCFFAERGVLEVETPILSAAGNTEPNIDSFHTHFSGHTDAGPTRRWLRTSPEYPLKRLLAAGIGDCYELGRVFRNGEAGGRHNPEFTMLEWYRLGLDHRQLADECAALIQRALSLVKRSISITALDYRSLYQQTLGLDPMQATNTELQAALGGVMIDPAGLTRDDWLDLLMTHQIQPHFPPDQLLLLTDYPASQCMLAQIARRGDIEVAERFEVFLGPLELANGYHELRDVDEQRRRFERDLATRRTRGQRLPPVDEPFLSALPALPECAGVALGVDRLLMAMLGTARIADVLAFDFSRA